MLDNSDKCFSQTDVTEREKEGGGYTVNSGAV
jgi:hypothetical protein